MAPNNGPFVGLCHLLVATVVGAVIVDNTLSTSSVATSPTWQPLLLIYHRDQTTERFSLAFPSLRGDAIVISVSAESELWLMCAKRIPQEVVDLEGDDVRGTGVAKNREPRSNWKLSHTKCSSKIFPAVRKTKTHCGPRAAGTIYKIGFRVYHDLDGEEKAGKTAAPASTSRKKHPKKAYWKLGSDRGESSSSSPFGFNFFRKKSVDVGTEKSAQTDFITLYEACYDVNNNDAIYTRHTIYGSAYEAKERFESIPVLPDSEWEYDHPQIDQLYDKGTQFENFKKMLAEEVTNYNDRASRYLVKMQLVPAEDMIFYAWRSATFLQLNATPQFETINGRRWRIMEEIVRRFAAEKKMDFSVITGTYNILRLTEKNRSIYLDPLSNKIKVSSLMWKVLYRIEMKEAIVFLTSNNPFQTSCEISICSNICHYVGFSDVFSNEPTNGCTICCVYKEVRSEIKEIPKLEVENVLSF